MSVNSHAAIIQRLERQLKAVQDSPRYARALGESLRSELIQNVPMATGNLASKMLRLGGPSQGYSSSQVWIGDKRRLGNPERAPRGTIAAFLRDFPQYKRRRKNAGRFNKSQAWWMLSREAKAKLQSLRAQGMYGGGYQGVGSDKAAYFYPQEGSQPEWEASARAAGISPTRFVEKSVQVWTGRDIQPVVDQYLEDIRRA